MRGTGATDLMSAKGKGALPKDDGPSPPSVMDPIGVAIFVLEAMRKTCGAGSPDAGSMHHAGADMFRRTVSIMDRTDSPKSWQGSAADAHTLANRRQQQCAQKMADVDAAVAKILWTEAGHVQATRSALDDAISYLKTCAPIADAMSLIPRGGEIAAMVFQAAVIMTAVPPAKKAYNSLVQQSFGYAAALRTAGSGYSQALNEQPVVPASRDALRVNPAELLPIAERHREAALSTAEAASATEQAPQVIERSHGIVCTPTVWALRTIHPLRTRAAELIQTRSEYLCDSVVSAADQYVAADQHLSERTGQLQFPA